MMMAMAQDTAAPTEVPITPAPTSLSWQGCEDPVNGPSLVTIGEKTTICLVISDGPDWSGPRSYMRLNFQPIADTYSRFHVPNSFKQLVIDPNGRVGSLFSGNITVHTECQKALSYQKWYFNGGDKVFPFLTAIIDVENGVVRGITWDDASIFCSPDEAERNTFDFNGLAGSEEKFGQPVEGCFLSLKNECTVQTETGTQCDLLLYVVWTGTDSKGNSFLSSSYRFSAFPAQDWSDRIMNNLPEFKIPDLNPFDDGGGNEGE